MIIPKPTKCEIKDSLLTLESPIKMYSEQLMVGVLELLKNLDKNARITDIRSKADIVFLPSAGTNGDEYRIICDESGITVFSSSPALTVSALSTLRQIAIETEGAVSFPVCDIIDRPRFSWRGLSVDVCRHFFEIPELYKIVDILCFYKFNRLHLHLSDDQGFRIEINRYPKLNEIGSNRKSSLVKKGEGEVQDGVPCGGFYTKKEIKELVVYARNRGIEIVPEIDIPGHSSAITASYPELCCCGEPTEVVTEYGIKDFSSRILCAGSDGVYEFIKSVLLEIVELFPFQYIHLGGDEAVKSEWKKCPRCRARMKTLGIKNTEGLQSYMFNVFSDFLKSMGRKAVFWNDGLTRRTDPDALCQLWTPRFVKSIRPTVRSINHGRKAIISYFDSLYFDYPFSMTPLKKTYNTVVVPRGVKAEAVSSVLGVEATIWTEWITDREKLWYNLLPRLAAISEVAWSNEADRDYKDFLSRLPDHYAFYEKEGYPFAKNKEKSGFFIKNWLTSLKFMFKDGDIELKQ